MLYGVQSLLLPAQDVLLPGCKGEGFGFLSNAAPHALVVQRLCPSL